MQDISVQDLYVTVELSRDTEEQTFFLFDIATLNNVM